SLRDGKPARNINGIAFKDQNEIVVNPPRDHIKDLESLPFPNRKKIDFKNYLTSWKDNHGYSSITVNTQRGCPFTCKWCSHAVYGDTYRRRSPKNVVQELKSISQEYNPDRFWFVDDVFTMSKKWLQEFNSALKTENLSISYECISRADKLDEEVVDLLKESGCALIWIGAESGSQKVLDMMDRRVDAKQVREMIKLAKNAGIQTGTFIMLGYPGEVEEDILESIEHLKECDPDYFTINKAYPIKGTRLYDEVEDLIVRSADWKTTPDNEIDFERSYKSRYYDFAIRKVYNDVWQSKHRNNGDQFKSLKCKLKSSAASLGMLLTK
ncbi:radical SAM protein, partial [Desulfosarcina sp.]|nr:radical SAM protein [Desulfosarcina sp.]